MKGIYSIINVKNHKRYIGKANDINSRIDDHFKDLRKNNHVNKRLQNSFNKYGENNFKFEIIFNDNLINSKKLYELEKEFIEKYDSYNNGFNLTKGGEGVDGLVHSSITKNQISKHNNQSSKIEIEGIIFNSITEASKFLNLTQGQIRGRIRSNLPQWENYKRLQDTNKRNKYSKPVNLRKIVVNEIEYSSITQCSKEINMPLATLYQKLKKNDDQKFKFKD